MGQCCELFPHPPGFRGAVVPVLGKLVADDRETLRGLHILLACVLQAPGRKGFQTPPGSKRAIPGLTSPLLSPALRLRLGNSPNPCQGTRQCCSVPASPAVSLAAEGARQSQPPPPRCLPVARPEPALRVPPARRWAPQPSGRTGPPALSTSSAVLPASLVSMATAGCRAVELGTGARHDTRSCFCFLREAGGTRCFQNLRAGREQLRPCGEARRTFLYL